MIRHTELTDIDPEVPENAIMVYLCSLCRIRGCVHLKTLDKKKKTIGMNQLVGIAFGLYNVREKRIERSITILVERVGIERFVEVLEK